MASKHLDVRVSKVASRLVDSKVDNRAASKVDRRAKRSTTMNSPVVRAVE